MPSYEFICNDCLKVFEKYMTLEEKEKVCEDLVCPVCGSVNVSQYFGNFMTFVNQKFGPNGGACGPPGCCG